MFFCIAFFLFGVGQVSAAVVDSDSDLLDWRLDNLPQVRDTETFGNVVYDPVAAKWRLFTHDNTNGVIVQYDSTTPRGPWANRATALAKGVTGSWDANETGVPFAWYEAGQARPWRMVYRGKNSDSKTQIGLVTSTDGTTWERTGPDGVTLLKTITNAVGNGSGLVRITSPGHGLSTGRTVSIYGVTGTTEANGNWHITRIDDNTFDLEGTTFTNAYVSSGVVSFPIIWLSDKKTITSEASDGGLIRITSAGHGLTTGSHITIWGATGTHAANGDWTITRIDANTFDLQGSTWAGTWNGGYFGAVGSIETGNTDANKGWDASGFDHHGIIKYGSTFYFPYNTTGTPRVIGLATSTDLLNWTKDADNPILQAYSDYDDASHDGTADNTAGYFCGDIVRWDRTDGTTRFVFFVPHYSTGNTLPSIDVFTSATPIFKKANRTYIGKAFRTDGTPVTHYFEGKAIASSGIDTPAVVTDDITRNVVTSTLTGDDVLMFIAVYPSTWQQAFLIYNKSLHGSVLSSVVADLPNTAPVYGLQPVGSDANVIGLWLPGTTGTLRELSNYDYHLNGEHSGIGSK